jgi:hypothetical protein
MSFWDERSLLEKELKEQGDLEPSEKITFGFMENECSGYIDPETGLEINAFDFLEGWCDTFAFELEKCRPDAKAMGAYQSDVLIHAFVIVPEGYLDIRGLCPDLEQLLKTFNDEGLIEDPKEVYFQPLEECTSPDVVHEAARAFLRDYGGYYGI